MRVIKSLFGLLIALHVFFPFQVFAEVPPIPDEEGYVFDYSDVLSKETIERLNKNSRALDEATGAQIVILTVDTIGRMEPGEFGTKVIREWGIGDRELNNGLLIYVTTEQGEGNNDVWISVGQGLQGVLPDGKVGRYIDDYMLSHLQEGAFDFAFENIYQVIYEDVSAEYGWTNENYLEYELSWKDWAFIIIFLIFFVTIGFIVLKYGKRGDHYDGNVSHDSGDSVGSGGGGFSGGGGSSDGGGAGRSF